MAGRTAVKLNPGVDVVANGQNTAKTFTLTIPAGEMWRVLGVSILGLTGVGEAMTIAPWFQTGQGGGALAIGPPVVLPASAQQWSVSSFAPFWASSGSKFGVWGSNVTGVPTAALTVLAVALKI